MALDARAVLRTEADTERPLIHHLTADNSWLVQLPRPGPRPFYNIIIDPWLTQEQIEFSSWFHRQGHTLPCAANSIAEVETFLGEIEAVTRELRSGEITTIPPSTVTEEDDDKGSLIDAVAICLEGTDHCNKETLLQLPPGVPIFARGELTVKLVQSYQYFDTVVPVPDFRGEWRSTSIAPLPEGIGIGGVIQPNDFTTLHSGIVVSFASPYQQQPDNNSSAECILYTPHGIPAKDLAPVFSAASPPLSVLAVCHGLVSTWVGFRLFGFYANLGTRNGLAVTQTLKSKYWIPTHDELKDSHGLTSWILTNDVSTVEDVAAESAKKTGRDVEEIVREANCCHLGSGASLVLA